MQKNELQPLTSKAINLRLVTCVVYAGFTLTQIGEAAIAPLLPFEAKKRGVQESVIGIIMGIHPLFNVFITIWMTKHLNNLSRKKIMGFGNIMQCIGYIVLAFITYIPDEKTGYKGLFITLALIGRLFSGIGVLLFQAPCYSLVAILFREKAEMKISLLEMFFGVGMVLGSGQESLLYRAGGYVVPFIVPAVYVLLLMPLVMIAIPSNQQIQEFEDTINQRSDDQSQSGSELISPEISTQSTRNQKVSYTKMAKNFKLVLLFNMIVWLGISFLYLGPTYSVYLQEQVFVAKQNVAYFFAIGYLVYTLGNPVVALMLRHKLLLRRVSILIGICGQALMLYLQPPCKFTGINKPTVAQQLVVRGFSGLFSSLMFVPCVPVFIELLREIFPDVSEQLIGDAAGGLLMTSWNSGELLGPILGGLMVEHINFLRTSFIFGCVLSILALTYVYSFFFVKKINKDESLEIQSKQITQILKIQANESNISETNYE